MLAVVDADGHTGVVDSPITFGSEVERAAFLSWNAGSLPPWHTFDEAFPELGPQRWAPMDGPRPHVPKRNNFPTDEEIAPLWDEPTAIGAAEEHAESVIDTPIPAYVVTVTVNLDTLELSMRKA